MLAVIAFSYAATEMFLMNPGQQRHCSKKVKKMNKKSFVEESEL